MGWSLGAASVVLAAVQLRAGAILSLRMRFAIFVALGAALACGLLAYADVDAVLVDDDLLAAVSAASAVVLSGLAVVAAREIFKQPGWVPNEG